MLRRINENDLIGKTIKSVDAGAVNVLKIVFTDGATLQLWAEDAVNTSAGSIPGIFVDEPVGDKVLHNHFGEVFTPDTCPGCAYMRDNKDK